MESSVDVDRIVLDYLRAKGYHKTADELKLEYKEKQSMQTTEATKISDQGLLHIASTQPIASTQNFAIDLVIFGLYDGNIKPYFTEYDNLRAWVFSSIEFVKFELASLLFPIFVLR